MFCPQRDLGNVYGGDFRGDENDDDDYDNDGLPDLREIALGLNTNNIDSDGDGVADSEDAFPEDPDENTGVEILKKALLEPIRVISENSGFEGAVILEKVSTSKKANYGFDAQSGKYGDMITMGIVDPAKVTRAAVENAASVAGMNLTTEALITDVPEPVSYTHLRAHET